MSISRKMLKLYHQMISLINYSISYKKEYDFSGKFTQKSYLERFKPKQTQISLWQQSYNKDVKLIQKIFIQFLSIMSLQAIYAKINILKNTDKAKQMFKFFKSGVGEYGEGDTFVGLTNPECRDIASENKQICNSDVEELLKSKIHQQRFIGLVIMDLKFKRKENQEDIYNLYVKNINCVNNWDLVDLSAPNIMGKYILQKCQSFKQPTLGKDPRNILYQLVKSPVLWHRRISIISTLTFIRQGQFIDALRLSEMLLEDKEDLLHKAVGWMLREIGKRQLRILEQFLQKHYERIPRTSLRYSIQKFDEIKRQKYLRGKFQKLM